MGEGSGAKASSPVTEVVVGGELFDRICEKVPYTEGEARELVVTLLKTLGYLHKMKIAHRDLKPENLLLRGKANDTDVVLADFGFAKVTEGKNLQQVCGTPDCKKQTKKNATDLLMCLSAIST